MEPEESPDEDGPLFAYVHPDDRLWRHPSELAAAVAAGTAPQRLGLADPGSRRPGMASRTWTVAVLAGLVGALVASGVLTVSGEMRAHTTTVFAPITKLVTPPNTLAAAAVAGGPGWPAVVDAVAPSVASVMAWGADGGREGSAVVYGPDGDDDVTYLLTDARLVSEVGSIEVTFNGGVAVAGHLMRIDPTSGVAVLWVAGSDRAPGLGSADTLHEADGVMTLGGRSGQDSGTVSGSVSSLDRTVVDQDDAVATCGLLALSSTLPAGDDGGAVVDDHGSVVGIATNLVPDGPSDVGMSFAVPIDVAIHVAQQVIASLPVTHPWLGLDDTADLDSATAQRMGIAGGAEVVDVASDSPAAEADLQPDDVITGFDGKAVTSSGALLSLVARTAPGQLATLDYRRGPLTSQVRMRILEQPADLAG